MDIKTSKIKEVYNISEPFGQYQTLYHKLVMENGDKIDIGKNAKQEVGKELSYTITGDIGQHPFTKAKSANPNWEGNKSFPKASGGVSNQTGEQIARMNCVTNSLAFCKGSNCSEEHILKTADYFFKYVTTGEIPKSDENPF